MKKYREEHKDKAKVYAKYWYETNRESQAIKKKRYNQENKELVKIQQRTKYERGKEAYPERYILSAAKARAKKRGHEFNIELEDIIVPEFCPILGIKLQYNKGTQAGDSPALDRLDNNKGYIKGNVHIISVRANRLKGDCSLEEMVMLGEWARELLGDNP